MEINKITSPCRISAGRFAYINSIKFQRKLTTLERIDYLSYKFYERMGYNLDLTNPKTYNEKCQWLKVFYHDETMHLCVDKVTAPMWALDHAPSLKKHIVPRITVFHSLSQLLSAQLYDNTILKSNVGSGLQYFVNSSITKSEIEKICATWFHQTSNHFFSNLEFGYEGLSPAIIYEYVINFKAKYEFFCFQGKPLYYWVIFNDKTDNSKYNFYRLDGSKIPVMHYRPNFNFDIQQPYFFNELIEISAKLSSNFPHVRVDFFVDENQYYFSKMTFYTWGGYRPFNPKEFDYEVGKYLILPKPKLQ